MPEIRCSRCERSRRPAEFQGFGELLATATSTDEFPFASLRAWGEVDGVDVCPDCQMPAERRELAQRIVEMVEVALAERGSDPLPHEAALIAFALSLREDLGRAPAPPGPGAGLPLRVQPHPPPPPPDPAPGSELVTARPRSLSVEVAVTGAFLTGRPLRVPVGGYDELQQRLVDALKTRVGDDTWSANIESWRQGGTYHSGGGFTSMLPLVLARRDGPAMLERWEHAVASTGASQRDWWRSLTKDWDVEAISLRVDIYDLGMAVLNLTLRVEADKAASLSDVAAKLKRAVWLKPDDDGGVESAVTSALRAIARETTAQYVAAITDAIPDAAEEAWLTPFLRALSGGPDEGVGGSPDWGRLLWLHPVHTVRVREGRGVAAVARELAPTFHGTVGIPRGVFVAGIGWSAVAAESGASGTEIPLRLIELHWAYIALYMEIDRGLLALVEGGRLAPPDSLRDLEVEADRVFGDYMRVMHARGRLDSALASLGGDEFAMWELITAVTKFQPLVDGVDLKVKVLQDQSERRVQQAAARRDRRTSSILSGLTALTVVTVAVALLGNFVGTRSDKLGHLGLRVAVIVIALLTAIAVYRAAFRDRTHVRRRLTRTPGAARDDR
jgi:hypothetical protein